MSGRKPPDIRLVLKEEQEPKKFSKGVSLFVRTGLRAGVMAIATLVLLAGAAYASGSASYGPVNFSVKYTTPNYATPNTGTHKINSTVYNCHGPNSGYTMTLVRQRTFLPDYRYTSKSGTCGGGTYTKQWAVTDVGTFHYDIEKPSDSYTWTASGSYSWP